MTRTDPPANAAAATEGSNDWKLLEPHFQRLLDSSRPLAGAIRAFANESLYRREKRRLLQIASALESDKTAAEVFREGDNIEPLNVATLIWSPQDANSTRDLQRYSSNLRGEVNVERSMWRILAYPLALTCTLLVFALFMWGTVIPEFQKIYEGFDLLLPGPTRLVIQLRPIILVATGTCLVLTILWLLRPTIFSRGLRQSWAFRLPVFGRAYRNAAFGSFCQLMAMFTRTGAPAAPAIRIAGRGTLPWHLQERIRHLAWLATNAPADDEITNSDAHGLASNPFADDAADSDVLQATEDHREGNNAR